MKGPVVRATFFSNLDATLLRCKFAAICCSYYFTLKGNCHEQLIWKRQPELFKFDSRRHRCQGKTARIWRVFGGERDHYRQTSRFRERKVARKPGMLPQTKRKTVYTLRLIAPISYLGACYIYVLPRQQNAFVRKWRYTFVGEPLNHIHQDTKSARLIAVCKRSFILRGRRALMFRSRGMAWAGGVDKYVLALRQFSQQLISGCLTLSDV